MKLKQNTKQVLALLTLVIGLGIGNAAVAQDSLRVMVYNLLRYGAAGIGCTPTGVSARNIFFTPVMEATRPDIFGVNEVGPFEAANSPAQNILLNILQPIDPAYRRATVTFNNSQDITNAMFYNSDKVEIVEQDVLPQSFRNLDYYKFYYKGPGLALGDTTFIEVILVHFSASSSNTRLSQANAIMTYLDGLNRAGNFIVMGDFNMDSANEAPFQAMVAHSNPDSRLNDPINLGGTWSNNTNARRAWSQSTRNSSGSDCGVGGGLDDRFDLILCSDAIMNNSDFVGYRPGSYWIPGNPNAPNRSLPASASGSLIPLSDHYPVLLTLGIDRAVAAEAPLPDADLLRVLGQVGRETLQIEIGGETGLTGAWELELIDLQGKSHFVRTFVDAPARQRTEIVREGLSGGIYLLRLKAQNQPGIIKKVLLR
ncbi:MAG: endonuclease/exonuclease/phosphatase family protein [Bacteroidota bacterium]